MVYIVSRQRYGQYRGNIVDAYPMPKPKTYNETPRIATSCDILSSSSMAAKPPVYELLQNDTVNVPNAS